MILKENINFLYSKKYGKAFALINEIIESHSDNFN